MPQIPPSSGQSTITQIKTQFLPDYLTMIVSKYELVPSVYVIGGYSTQPYQATSKFPMEDLINSDTKEVIQPILRLVSTCGNNITFYLFPI